MPEHSPASLCIKESIEIRGETFQVQPTEKQKQGRGEGRAHGGQLRPERRKGNSAMRLEREGLTR